VTQEPIEKWRKFFFEELKEKFKKIESLETAALELNKWCGSKVKFKQTSPADQTPLETLRKGYGRCEEESIFYMAAARALLIPARYVYVPYWSTCDGNHAWIEVYTDDGWKYLGACEPAETLNQAWFTNPVRRAPIVLAKVIGRPPQDTKEEIYRQSNREVILNVTHVYAKTCKVKVKVMGSNGGLVRGIPVYFNIFNFGSLQPIAVFRTDKNGQGSIALGLGDFVLTTGTVKQFAWQKISTVPDGQLKIELRLKDLEKAVPEGSFWLRYPKPKK
ncbi:MAG: transglutaminase domain-containing protein, partial [Planctomycetes bacterium]|nr:transglutaminase domain-containing protein [Planctomycetota bacterium]